MDTITRLMQVLENTSIEEWLERVYRKSKPLRSKRAAQTALKPQTILQTYCWLDISEKHAVYRVVNFKASILHRSTRIESPFYSS